MFNFEAIEIDQDLLERTNPIFHTARMTLFQLAATGHDDATSLAEILVGKIHKTARLLRLMMMTFLLTVLYGSKILY